MYASKPQRWKHGLPPGKLYPGMVDDYEVVFAPLAKWHRRRTERGSFIHASARAIMDNVCCVAPNYPRVVIALCDDETVR